jgi:hypothetical protein
MAGVGTQRLAAAGIDEDPLAIALHQEGDDWSVAVAVGVQECLRE